MVITKIAPLSAPKLYPDDPQAILRAVYDTVYSASGGTINDFAPHSPVAALSEGLLFAILEQLYYANKLPDALSIAFLKVAGIQRIEGASAVVELTFTLAAPLGTAFTLSAGYIVKDAARHEFATDQTLTIPAGQIQGTVTATASAILNGERQAAIGSSYNVPAHSIRFLTESRAFLQSVTNLEAATGGRDGETMDDARSRGFAALRRRDVLVSADDYEQVAVALLGAGSVAVAIGQLGSNNTFQLGAVHVFVLNPDRSAPNPTQRNELRTELGRRSPVGLRSLIYVSPIELYNLEIHVIADLIPGSNPLAAAQRINQRLEEYFTPGNLPLGASVLIKEVETLIRNSGVAAVQSVAFLRVEGGDVEVSYGNVALPNLWTAATLYSLEVTLMDNGAALNYSFGLGGDKD